jgi:hypothetical protein
MLGAFVSAREDWLSRPGCIAMGSLTFRFYLLGYKHFNFPRVLRKVLARTRWHRAWLAGHMGLYEQDGRHCGVCDRDSFVIRKGK